MTNVGDFRTKLNYYEACANSLASNVCPIKGGDSCETVEVNGKTMHALKVADAVVKTVGSLLDKGNQMVDVVSTQGESQARTQLRKT